MQNSFGRVLTLPPPTDILETMNKKNSPPYRTLSATAAGIAALLAFHPSTLPAMPVTDAGAIAQLQTLNVTAAKILGDTTVINSNTGVIRDNTTQIMNDTIEIRKDVDLMQKDIEIMRKIGEARQALTLKIAQLSELTAQGNVFKADPFADAVATTGIADNGSSINDILAEMGQYMKTPDDLSGDPGLDTVTKEKMVEESFAQNTEPAFKIEDTDASSTSSTATGLADTLVTPQEGGMAEVRSKIESLFDNSWNGYGFTGKGAKYMQSMVGAGGRTLGLDYVPPIGSVVLSDRQKAILKGFLSQNVRENYRRVSKSGGNPWEVMPGLYVRPKTDADALYEEMVLGPNATAGSQTAFFAAAAVYAGSQYDPIRGFSAKAEYNLPVNINNMLSRGAYEAIDKYNRENGIPTTENPYGNFGKSIAPVISDIVMSSAPGRQLVITQKDLDRASTMKGISFNGAPSTADGWRDLFARSARAEEEFIRVATTGSTGAESDVFVVFGLNKGDTQTYNSKILESSTRLSQNNKTLLTQCCLLKYNQDALEKVIALEEALASLSSSATKENVVEMLPMLRESVQNTILVLQNRIGQLQAQIDSLLKDRHEALVQRQGVVEMYQKKIEDNSKGQVERLLMLASPGAVGM